MTRLRVPVQLRWSDMDAYGHVNNVEMLRLLEEARIEAFWAHPAPAEPLGDAAPTSPATSPAPSPVAETWPTAVLDAGPGAQTATLVARQEIEYLRPLGYRRTPVVVDMWIGHLGGASIDVCYEVQDEGHATGDPYARAVTTLVLVDAASGSPRRIGEAERAAWLPYVEDPPTFRRRGR